MNAVEVKAPAKINLGLEILGKRSDGFHEIRTVMIMLELADTLTFFVDEDESDDVIPGVRPEENLVRRALTSFRQAVPDSAPLGWRIEKRIPAAAGLGGASSDAAAALLAANSMAGTVLSSVELSGLAANLGSDIPFFLGAPAALASGRGTELSALPVRPEQVLLVVPETQMEAKTTSMYAALQSEDFSDGKRIVGLAGQLRIGLRPDASQLQNAFARAASVASPTLNEIQSVLRDEEGFLVGLSGAGPACYVLSPTSSHERIRQALRLRLPDHTAFISTSTRQSPLSIEPVMTDDLSSR